MPQADRRTDEIRDDLRALLDELFPLGRDEEPNAADLAQGAEWWARTCIWWAARCREAWASRDGLSAEVAALRAENEALSARFANQMDAATELLAEVSALRVQIERLTGIQVNGDWPRYLDARSRMIEAEAELAAERAQHETTRRAVEAVLDALADVRVYGERNSTYYCGAQTMAKRVRAALAAAASPSPSDDDTSSSSPVVACRTCQGQGGFPSGVLNVMGAAGEWYEPCPDCAPSPVAGGKTGWDYAEHPGDCHPRKVDAMWVVCCRECAGTGVFPVPWISTPEEGRKRMDDSSCVSCKGTGYSTVGLHGEPSPVAGQDQPKEPT